MWSSLDPPICTCSGSAKGPWGLGSTWGRGSGYSRELSSLIGSLGTLFLHAPWKGALTSINQYSGCEWPFKGSLGWEGRGRQPTPKAQSANRRLPTVQAQNIPHR